MATLARKLPWQHPFAGGYPGRSGQSLPTDPDAIDYLNRVAAADGASVEVGIAQAIEAFIVGCKADSAGYAGDPARTNWDAIKASCIMCGARTLSGALVSLRQYGPELWDAPTPTITNGGGSVGSWDATTRTMKNTGTGTLSTRPRFDFDFGSISGVSYRIVGKVSGDLSSLWRIFFGGTALTVAGDGTFSQTVTADIYPMSIYLYGNLGDASVTIEELSIKEVINDATNVANNFVEADYHRSGTPGLQGDGATKYLDTNRAGDADGDNDNHVAAFMTQGTVAVGEYLIGAMTTASSYTIAGYAVYDRTSTSSAVLEAGTGLYGVSRDNASDFDYVKASGGVFTSVKPTVAANQSLNHSVFAYTNSGGPVGFANARIAFYSVGVALDLAALDTRTTNLVTAIKFHSLTGLLPNDYDPDTISYIVAAIEAGGTL